MGRLQDQVAIVTGGASGIGRAIAHKFASEGAIAVIADLALPAAEATSAEFAAAGLRATAVAMDVSDEAVVEAGVAATLAAHGRIDILVSNAGIQIVHPLENLPLADWKRMLAIHLDGAFLITRACSGICFSTSGVRTKPGQTMLARTPCAAPSFATTLAKPTSPCLAVT